jgi:YebC/PmpR family DNA-binding regulatory protein
MGRAFEFRKARKFKRWGQMAKTFTKIGKDIVIAVKAGGGDPASNSRLRAIIQNAKAVNMPKENVERAIKRATSKDQEDYKEIVYEGYAMHGIAILVETTTDNINRTVANIRSSFTKCGGSLGTTGMLDFIFARKSVFKIAAKPEIDLEELESGVYHISDENSTSATILIIR